MGRPRKTTEKHFLDAALAILDAEGLEALTLRRLGNEVGVAATALYTYFENLSDLVEHLAGRVLADALDAAIWEGATPRDRLVAVGVAARAGIARHPRLLPVFVNLTRQAPGVSDAFGRTLATLREAGVGENDLPHVYQAFESFVLGATIFDFGGAPAHLDIRRKRYSAFEIPAFRAAARTKGTMRDSNDEAFRRGLEALLVGLGV
jgi:TetR/AcrR family tetracycline transcriptional repressor